MLLISVSKRLGAVDDVAREARLVGDHRVDPLLDGPPADELVYQHVRLLADPERAVGRLVLDGGVPPAVEVDDLRAAVRFSPVPPALSESTKKGGPSSRWKFSTSSRRLATGVPPWRTRPGRPKTPSRNSASGSVISRNCVKTSAFSCRSASSSQSSARRWNLPLCSGR